MSFARAATAAARPGTREDIEGAMTPRSVAAALVLAALPASLFARDPGRQVLAGARRQVAEGAVYTTGYFSLDYPGGDLPRTLVP